MPRVLITGASGGIGRELAYLFAADKYDLVLLARNGEVLKELAQEIEGRCGNRCDFLACDLSKPGVVAEISSYLEFNRLRIDILVNNAGAGTFGLFRENPIEDDLRIINLNIVSLVSLTKLLLPSMVNRREGLIMNIASVAGFAPGPMMAVYYASKAFVLSFSEALEREIRSNGVRVITVCPGPTETGFQKSANIEYFKNGDRQLPSAKAVAVESYRAITRRRSLVITGVRNRVLVFLMRFVPRNLLVFAVYRNQLNRMKKKQKQNEK